MSAAPVRLRRDGATWLLYAQLSVFAYFVYGFGPSVTLLRDEEHISNAIAGLHSTAYAIGVIVIGLAGQRIVGRLGRTRMLWLFLAGLCASVGVYASVARLPVTLAGALLAGGFAAGIVIAVNATLMDRHGVAGPAAITEANALAAAVGLFAPLAIGAAVHLGWGWRVALLVMVVAAGVLFGFRGALRDAPSAPGAPAVVGTDAAAVADTDAAAVADTGADTSTDADAVTGTGQLSRQFWLSYTMVVLCVGIEFSMTLWCAQLLRDRSGLNPAAAATGVTAIVGGMCAGRALGARVARRRDVDWLLARAFAVTAVGFAVFWWSSVGWLSFTGLAICGLGMALHYPLGIARTIRSAAGRSDLASARVTAGTGLAIAGAPFLLGFLSDLITVRYAFLLVPLLLLLASVTLVLARRSAPAGGVTPATRDPRPPESGGWWTPRRASAGRG